MVIISLEPQRPTSRDVATPSLSNYAAVNQCSTPTPVPTAAESMRYSYLDWLVHNLDVVGKSDFVSLDSGSITDYIRNLCSS